MGNCKVTVLMSVYNGEKYLKEAVDSILNQTFTDFEFLITNDASTDKSMEILRSYNDSRIKIVSNEKNLGLTKSLNKGLSLAKGEYIARMDADDISDPYRLEKQVYFLDMHPEIGILGTQYRLFDSNSRNSKIMVVPTCDVQIRWNLLFKCTFAHPTVMIRKNVLLVNKLKYDEAFFVAEDYELWTRLLKYTRGANLKECLLQYRIHSTNASVEHRKKQFENRDIISSREIQNQFKGSIKNNEDFNYLQYIFFGNRKLLSSLCQQRVDLIEKYLDMLDEFIYLHQNESDLKALKNQEALKIARLCIFLPLEVRSIHIFQRLMLLDLGLLFSLIGFLFKAILLKLKLLLFKKKELTYY